MRNKIKTNKHISQTIEREASTRASIRARSARWDLNIAVFLFILLILVIILLYQGVDIAIVAPTAALGLTFVWLAGWQRGKKLYDTFYEEELLNLKREFREKTPNYRKIVEKTVEEQVQKALRESWIR